MEVEVGGLFKGEVELEVDWLGGSEVGAGVWREGVVAGGVLLVVEFWEGRRERTLGTETGMGGDLTGEMVEGG